jgi:hypothetical protein
VRRGFAPAAKHHRHAGCSRESLLAKSTAPGQKVVSSHVRWSKGAGGGSFTERRGEIWSPCVGALMSRADDWR